MFNYQQTSLGYLKHTLNSTCLALNLESCYIPSPNLVIFQISYLMILHQAICIGQKLIYYPQWCLFPHSLHSTVPSLVNLIMLNIS